MSSDTATPRIPPRPASEWDTEVIEALDSLGLPAGTFDRDNPDRPASTILATFAQHPELAKAFLTFNKHVLFHSSVDHRTHEIAVLRILWLRRAEYEWANHVSHGAKLAGMTRAEIEAVSEGPDAPMWEPFDAAVVRAVDELCADGFISDVTWETLSSRLDRRQLMDLIFAVGTYELLAMAFNSFRIQMEPGMKGFDQLPERLTRRAAAGKQQLWPY